MASEEEKFRKLAVELRILEGTAETLQSRINIVNSALTELNIANMTLEGLEKEKQNSSLLVPIGGGSYIKAKLESADTIIVGIGAGVAAERTISEAKENLGKRIADVEKTRAALQQQLVQVIQRIQEGREELQKLTAKLSRGEEKTKGVRKAKKRT
ncbi:prefoldin subunit alpha [Candidatus Bathyarchaeota archaeon]|nr:MAG: prefoldin subunit alpha [Candidatus Bathyarchaeota archaeon]